MKIKKLLESSKKYKEIVGMGDPTKNMQLFNDAMGMSDGTLSEAEEEVDNFEQEEEDQVQNEPVEKDLSFPLLVEAFDDTDTPIEIPDDEVEEYVSTYAEEVELNIEENKKFILSSLETFDFSMEFSEFDSNSNIHFSIVLNSDVSNDLLMDTIRRYLNVDVDDYGFDGGYMTLTPVTEKKYLTII